MGNVSAEKEHPQIEDLSNITKQNLKKMWKEFDTKYPKGTLTRKEFIEDNMRLKGGSEEFWSQMFEILDTTKNGFVSFKEYMILLTISTRSTSSQESLSFVFDLIDVNKDNQLSLSEVEFIGAILFKKIQYQEQFVNLISSRGVVLVNKDIATFSKELFKLMDENNDGLVTRKEFISTCIKNPMIQQMLTTSLDQFSVLFDNTLHVKKNVLKNENKSHQVGGHKVMIFDGELVYKPYVKEEFFFYENMYMEKENCFCHDELRKLTPVYKGKKFFEREIVTKLGKKKKKVDHYIILENLTMGMKRPCVLDCKMGIEGYAKKHSKLIHKKLYQTYVGLISTSKKYGFRISGMKVWKKNKNEYLQMTKDSGLKTKSKHVVDRFVNFINNGERIRTELLKLFLPELEKIKKFFETQKKYSFFSTSIIFMYDGESEKADKVVVKLVDFAHIFEDKVKDENVLFGVNCLITMFKDILKTYSVKEQKK